MVRSSWLRSPLLLLLVASTAGCGLRSDPFAPDDGFVGDDDDGNDDDSDPGDPNRPGTCNDPLPIPFQPTRLSGNLSGPSFQEGWCGSDDGPEDVYFMIADQNADVTIEFDLRETEFPPTLRVVENGCSQGEGFTKICTGRAIDEPFHFFASVGNVYSIIVDSRDGTEGSYAFDVRFGEPPLAQCDPHPEIIVQQPGSAFLWTNDFSEGQGRVDSTCGGPGRENMFRLTGNYAGNAFARVISSGGFAPLISVRRGCGTNSEITCTSAPAGAVAELPFFIEGPGEYFVVIDQAQIGSGGYELRIDFE